jgi:hypothetical protein
MTSFSCQDDKAKNLATQATQTSRIAADQKQEKNLLILNLKRSNESIWIIKLINKNYARPKKILVKVPKKVDPEKKRTALKTELS